MKYLSLLLLFVANVACADIYIVVHQNSPIQSVDIEEIADVYLGRRKSLGDLYIDQVLDRTGEERRRFFESTTHMRISQVNAYWAKLKFSGRMRAPEGIASRVQLVEKLKQNPQAIGYMLEKPPNNSGIRVVLHINE